MSGQHRRRTPLIRLLARLGWQRDPDLWTVPCRDLHGRRARLLIRLSPSGITLSATAQGPLQLTALEVGRLRGATRDAIRTCGLLTGPDHAESPPSGRHSGEPTASNDRAPTPRQVFHVERASRPTVADLLSRCQVPST